MASWRVGDTVRHRKVLRDTQHDSTPEQIMAAASSEVPEVRTWRRAKGSELRWAGEREEVTT